ncbi:MULTISPECIES: hypothetical protein [unclassified Streptomyces]|uniref:hypothetical protein n=1 Tax=unclassified Streptomyces TaxID=2593676 RepID=UPI00224D98B5|nr:MULTISPECIES: hypothetical protein [unclassified Streptomyces]MCX5052394.1 hypothetical protein [Streptomyces sp. NBC_00474]MCX5251559.1 hypothetical protein [Streptomyces sp. NBC_00201]MCX5294517.1 hypothetical protein [Streptomyces sp. NBC_00183]
MTMNRALRHGGRALGLTAVVLGTIAAAVPAAADEQPTSEQIMADCASGEGKCSFNSPKIGEAYLGKPRQVSELLYNCTASSASQSMSWADTVGSSQSVGGSVTVGGGIEGIVTASVTATYNYTWQSSHTETSSFTVTVQPGEVGWISRAQVMQQITGTWQTHYDDPRWGHYYWFVPDVITGPATNGTDGKHSAVVVKSRKMTATERKLCSTGSTEDKVFTRSH